MKAIDGSRFGKRLGFLFTLARGVPLLVGATIAGLSAPAAAQGVCNPQCGAGQLCVQGTCMVPAAPAYAPPPAAYPPPPAGYQQTSPAPAPAPYVPPQANSYPPPPSGVGAPPAQGYPPANNYPPQQYAPQQGYPPPPPQDRLSQRRGFLALPFIGINSFQGSTGNNLGAGFRLGVFLGGHVNEMFSANGELTIDVLNVQDLPPGTSSGAADVVLAFSPLVHIPFGNAEFAVGPKLGFRSGATTVTSAGADTTSRVSGFVFGVNAGIFAAVSDSISLGGLLMAEIRSVREYCVTQPGFAEVCGTDAATTGSSDKVIGLAGGALF